MLVFVTDDFKMILSDIELIFMKFDNFSFVCWNHWLNILLFLSDCKTVTFWAVWMMFFIVNQFKMYVINIKGSGMITSTKMSLLYWPSQCKKLCWLDKICPLCDIIFKLQITKFVFAFYLHIDQKLSYTLNILLKLQ